MEEKIVTNATLCFPVRDREVLLARKKRHIGAGLWNGYGGSIEAGEKPKRAALRELEQESGIRGVFGSLVEAAVIDFHNVKATGEPYVCHVYAYLLTRWKREPKETEEMGPPTWFPFGRLPRKEMMPADPFWLPRILKGERLFVQAWYGPNQQSLLRPVEFLRISGKP